MKALIKILCLTTFAFLTIASSKENCYQANAEVKHRTLIFKNVSISDAAKYEYSFSLGCTGAFHLMLGFVPEPPHEPRVTENGKLRYYKVVIDDSGNPKQVDYPTFPVTIHTKIVNKDSGKTVHESSVEAKVPPHAQSHTAYTFRRLFPFNWSVEYLTTISVTGPEEFFQSYGEMGTIIHHIPIGAHH